jgi:hypothetical protein
VTPLPAPAGSCANCGSPFVPEPRRFCPECGQETTARPPRIAEFIQQFGGAYVSTEGALWRTLRLLLLRPGELTNQYLAGRRKHYVLPLRLYLTISLVVLLLLRLTADVVVVDGIERAEARQREQPLQTLVVHAWPLALGLREGRFVCEGMPATACSLLRQRAVLDAPTFLQRMRQANARVVDHFGLAMFLLLPLFAALLALLRRDRGLRYTEHLVFALHLHAFWFLLLGLAALAGPGGPVAAAAGVVATVYAAMAGRRVYGGSLLAVVVRSLLLAVLYSSVVVVAVAGFWLLALVA